MSYDTKVCLKIEANANAEPTSVKINGQEIGDHCLGFKVENYRREWCGCIATIVIRADEFDFTGDAFTELLSKDEEE